MNPAKVETASSTLAAQVEKIVATTPVGDIHTHLYDPAFGQLLLLGIDDLLTYHYLVSEVFLYLEMPYEKFWKMTKTEQADHIWKNLFIDNSPVGEACRGVLTTLQKLGIDTSARDLKQARKFFAGENPDKYIDRVMEIANVSSITMTNPVFDDNERQRWLAAPEKVGGDPRFKAVLRIDPLLRDFPAAAKKTASWNYSVEPDPSAKTIEEARRFLRDWIDPQKAIHLAVSLPPDFRYPAAEGADATIRAGQTMLEKVVLPVCAEHNVPFAMMIGSYLRVNPDLREAGDMLGKSDVQSVVRLCRAFPQNRFFVTMLSRENQHELCVAARKFGNLMVFGCWWFLNNPSLIEEIERMRFELLNTSFIPQHSDARVLDQLIYKWDHSRRVIGKVLTDKYQDLAATGWPISKSDVERDVKKLLAENFTNFLLG